VTKKVLITCFNEHVGGEGRDGGHPITSLARKGFKRGKKEETQGKDER